MIECELHEGRDFVILFIQSVSTLNKYLLIEGIAEYFEPNPVDLKVFFNEMLTYFEKTFRET